MGFKLITRDEIFYPADYGLKVGDELNVVLTGGGGSVMAYSDPVAPSTGNATNNFFPMFYNNQSSNYPGTPPGYSQRADTPPTPTRFGRYAEAQPGVNSKTEYGALSRFASGGPTTASTAIGGGGGWLPGVATFGGRGGRESTVKLDNTFVMAEGAPGLAGEGTTAQANIVRFNGNPYGGHVSGTSPQAPVGMAVAEDVNKAWQLFKGNSNGLGSGAGAGFGAGAGAILQYRGSAAGAETKFITHRITEEDMENGIPVRVGRPGSFHNSRFVNTPLPTTSSSSTYTYLTQASVNNSLSQYGISPAGNIFGAPPKRMNLVPPTNTNCYSAALAQNGASVMYSSRPNDDADFVLIPDITKPWEYQVDYFRAALQITWSRSAQVRLKRIKYVNGYWIACLYSDAITGFNGITLTGTNYMTYAYTTDPTKGWDLSTTSIFSEGFNDVVYFNGKYVFLRGNNDANNCVYATEDLSVAPTPLTLPAFSSTNMGYYPYQTHSGFIISDEYLYIVNYYNTSNVLYLSAWCTTDLVNWSTPCMYKNLGSMFNLGQVQFYGKDLFAAGIYSSNSSIYCCQVRFENGTYKVIKAPNLAVGSYFFEQTPVFVFENDRVYLLPTRGTYGGQQRGHTIVSYPIETELTGSWQECPGREYGSEFYRSTGYVLSGAIAVYQGILYLGLYSYSNYSASVPAQTGQMQSYYANGWFEVAVDDLFTMYPDSFKVSGHKSAEDSYQDDWRYAGHILSGADGCCEIFW